MRKTLLERIEERLDKSGECWIWTGARAGKGYGVMTAKCFGRFRHQYTHRMMWELHNGDIPDGLFVLHNCPGGDNPACCNPAHLWLGTHRDNCIDRWNKAYRLGWVKWQYTPHARKPPPDTWFPSTTKLTREMAISVLARLATGEPAISIANSLGVSASTISRIRHGSRWQRFTGIGQDHP